MYIYIGMHPGLTLGAGSGTSYRVDSTPVMNYEFAVTFYIHRVFLIPFNTGCKTSKSYSVRTENP